MSVFSESEIIDDALTFFRKNGFPYRKLPLHVCKQEINRLSELPDDKLDTANLGYQVADTYHPERFMIGANRMKSPLEGFHTDKTLRRCLSRMLKQGSGIKTSLIGGVGGIAITSGVQAASNFRPAFALKMYRRFCSEGATILDTSAGFGGRLVGFFAHKTSAKYIGVDPNTTVCRNNLRMAKDLGFKEAVRMINLPVEDVSKEDFRETADFAFTSPPYFTKECYPDSGNTQSWVRYPDGELWRVGFLGRMMEFQYSALKDGSYSAVNIADVKIGRHVYPLVDWCVRAGEEAGFMLVSQESLRLQQRIGSGHSEGASHEQVLIFQKA